VCVRACVRVYVHMRMCVHIAPARDLPFMVANTVCMCMCTLLQSTQLWELGMAAVALTSMVPGEVIVKCQCLG